MNTLLSVVNVTTRFVPCQYPAQQNSGCNLITVINVSLQSDLAWSSDKPPGKTLPRLFVPLHYSPSDPRHVFPFHTGTDDLKLLLTRAPPRREPHGCMVIGPSWAYCASGGAKTIYPPPNAPMLRAFERRPP